ncbi:MAG TPA: hypothetical protein VFC51_13690, partial [Chloroflexota bacterium]|nr:hypothetical protein [Chloroflexota bacterium]
GPLDGARMVFAPGPLDGARMVFAPGPLDGARMVSSLPGRGLLPWVALGLAFALSLRVLNLPYVDDAFITLTYARTLFTSGTWGMFPGQVANTATSPLDVVLLGAMGRALGSYTGAVVVASALELLALSVAARSLARRLFGSPVFAVVATVAVATNPLVLSSLGLEGLLSAALLLAVVWCWLAERFGLMAVFLGLAALARPDALLLAILLGGLLMAQRRLRWEHAALFLGVIGPWVAFSWTQLGWVVPDTLILKVAEGAFVSDRYANGWQNYARAYPLATLGSLILAPFAVLALRSRRGEVRGAALLLLAYAATHFVAYSLLRVWAFQWYYLQEVVPLELVGALGVAELRDRVRGAALTTLVGALPPVAALVALVLAVGYPIREPFIHSNWATMAQYREIGLWVRDHTDRRDRIAVTGEVGTLAFYADRDFVSPFTSSAFATALIRSVEENADASMPPVAALVRLSTAWRRAAPTPDPSFLLEHSRPGAGDPAAFDGSDALMVWETSTRWYPNGREVFRRHGP